MDTLSHIGMFVLFAEAVVVDDFVDAIVVDIALELLEGVPDFEPLVAVVSDVSVGIVVAVVVDDDAIDLRVAHGGTAAIELLVVVDDDAIGLRLARGDIAAIELLVVVVVIVIDSIDLVVVVALFP